MIERYAVLRAVQVTECCTVATLTVFVDGVLCVALDYANKLMYTKAFTEDIVEYYNRFHVCG